jgi:hypothetical protein
MRKFLFLAMILILVLTACGTPATEAPAPTKAPATEAPATEAPATEAPATEAPAAGGFQIPEVQEGKFNVGMVLIGPHDDGGWSQAHYEGLLYIEENVPNVHVAYIENVPEGADSEQVFRSLARKGFDLIFGTSFGFGDPMEVVAEEFPDTMFIHLTGIKSNGTNFGNLMGAMENMKYLAGMLAGAPNDGNRNSVTWSVPNPGRDPPGAMPCTGYGRPAPNARWISAGSTPGTILSLRRKPRPPCSMRARKLSSPAPIPPPWRMWRRKKANGA